MFLLNPRSKQPLYEQLVEQLRRQIILGGMKAGAAMPSVRQLATELGINPNTIQRAYQSLEQEGFIYTVVGRGNFVSSESSWQSSKHKALTADLTKVIEQALDAGMSPASIQQILDQTITKHKEGQSHD